MLTVKLFIWCNGHHLEQHRARQVAAAAQVTEMSRRQIDARKMEEIYHSFKLLTVLYWEQWPFQLTQIQE